MLFSGLFYPLLNTTRLLYTALYHCLLDWETEPLKSWATCPRLYHLKLQNHSFQKNMPLIRKHALSEVLFRGQHGSKEAMSCCWDGYFIPYQKSGGHISLRASSPRDQWEQMHCCWASRMFSMHGFLGYFMVMIPLWLYHGPYSQSNLWADSRTPVLSVSNKNKTGTQGPCQRVG